MKQGTSMADIAVVGGGAAGLMAALTAAETGCGRILLLERHPRVGKKLLATGNGRCNLTNVDAEVGCYHGTQTAFCRFALSAYPPRKIMEAFERMGVMCKVEGGGRVYPYSDQASSVLDCLRMALRTTGDVDERCIFEVQSIEPTRDAFRLSNGEECLLARRVIVATGGKASPNLCSDGSGYPLLSRLGHRTTTLFPALVQIRTDNRVTRALKGIKLEGAATLFADGKPIQCETGEILFAEYGLSGPPLLALSRRASEFGETGKIDGQPVSGAEIALNLFPGEEVRALKDRLAARLAYRPDLTLEEFFIGMLHKRIGQEIWKGLGFDRLSQPAAALSGQDLERLAVRLCDWRFSVRGGHSFQNAQVTAGGIATDQVDERTMESRMIPGLYLAGEVLDIDGDCGGFNLQWAWSSGALAGCSAAKSLQRRENREC